MTGAREQHKAATGRLSDHVGHRWYRPSRRTRHVYCWDCGVGLYQGVCYNVETKQRQLAGALDEIRAYILAHPELLDKTVEL